ncbi:MAG TPA: zf-HC2 domain-containing protein [Blastocatellia bacterium]|nr:zf-HC2 domain-containing protein [Blastocatellia bacterium]
MKFFGQAKDGVIDNLLRAYVSRPSNPHQKCTDFDPDQANAYIERSLTGASRFHYEEHLSECAACRKNVVALVRLAEAETPTSVAPARGVPRFTLLSGAKQMFGALSQPQWAMVAAAVIVAAISVPLLLTRNESQKASVAVAEPSAPASPVANPTSENAAPSTFGDATSRQREKSDEKTEVLARTAPTASKPTDAPAGVGGVADVSKKLEVSDAVQPVDERRKSEGKVAQALAQGGAAPTSQVTKNDSDQGRQQQPEKDSTQQPNESKAARADQQSNEKEKTARAEEAAAPPAPPSTSEAARGAMKRSPAKLSLRDSNAGTESVRAEQKEFKGKKFSFRDGAWTDKEFDPNKDLPVVTIIRDSNTYKELISKRAGLRSIMERFTPAERAIIVYKGTVYKLIPQ